MTTTTTHPSDHDGPDPSRRNAASHQAILDATVELLEDGGYEALSIEGVARRAGVGKQTIYRWWDGSKAALVLEAFTDVGTQRVTPVDTGDVRADLLAILEPVFDLHDDYRTGTSLANKTLMAQAQLDASFHPRYVELHRQWHGPLLAALQRAIDGGQIDRDTDPRAVVDLLLGAAWYRLLLEHAPLDDDAASGLVDLVLDGCATRRGPTDEAGRPRPSPAAGVADEAAESSTHAGTRLDPGSD